MKIFAEFLKTTLAGGLLVLLPLFGCAFLLVRLVGALLGFIKPLLTFLPDYTLGSMAIVDLTAIFVLLLACFLIGLIVTTPGGRAFGNRVESRILFRVPGYTLFQSLTNMVFGLEETKGAPVIVRLEDAWQVGFLVEERGSGESTVYFPDAPTLLTGTVIIVRRECVEKLNVPKAQVIRSMANFGIGLNALLPDKLPTGIAGKRRHELVEPASHK